MKATDKSAYHGRWKGKLLGWGIALLLIAVVLLARTGLFLNPDLQIKSGVTAIRENAYKGKSRIRTVVIPNTVTEIGQSAFQDCKGMTSVSIPDSVTQIGELAFQGCSALKSVVLPRGITVIPYALFRNCTALESVEIPDTVVEIDMAAFDGCSSLTHLVIPDSVRQVGASAFRDCAGLASVSLPAFAIGNEYTKSDDRTAFVGCGAIRSVTVTGDYAGASARDAIGHSNQSVDVQLSRTVTRIGASAFRGLENLQAVEIPDSVVEIGEEAFADCSGLAAVTVPDSVVAIGKGAFEGCEALTQIALPATIDEIGDNCFSGCRLLEHLDIPDSVTRIGRNAFYGCSGMRQIDLPRSLTEIGGGAFDNAGLTHFELPDGFTAIGEYGFRGCPLSSFVIPETVEYIGRNAFAGCNCLASIDIPKSVKEIGEEAFAGCSVLQSATVAAATIGERAFANCENLASVTLTEDVTAIRDYVLTGSALSSLSVPASVTGISPRAFCGTAFFDAGKQRIPDRLTEAEDIRYSSEKPFREDVGILPLDREGLLLGDLFCAMPEEIRTLDAVNADYVLVVTYSDEARNDYVAYTTNSAGLKVPVDSHGTLAYDKITRAFLCSQNGDAFLIYEHVSAPPASGYGGTLYGKEATGAEVWEAVEHFFHKD